MDEVVSTIREARNVSDARATLESSFDLSAEQSDAILSMQVACSPHADAAACQHCHYSPPLPSSCPPAHAGTSTPSPPTRPPFALCRPRRPTLTRLAALVPRQLRRLTALEQQTLLEEAERLRSTCTELQGLLADRTLVLRLISAELAELKAKFATPRRTRLGDAAEAELRERDLMPREQCIVIRSNQGYFKRLPLDDFDAQQRGTRGKAGMTNLPDGDCVVQMLQCSSHDTVLCLSSLGVAYALPAYKVPSGSRASRGTHVRQLLPIGEDESVATVVTATEFSPSVYLVLLTRNGWVKKTPLLAFERITARGLIAVSLEGGDALVRASLCTADDALILCSAHGQAVRFETNEVQLRASGRQSRGVKSMRMSDGDTIADMFVLSAAEAFRGNDDGAPARQMLVAVTAHGFGKRVSADKFRSQQRGGKGVIAIKFKNRDDRLVALSPARDDDELLLVTQKGTLVRQRMEAISEQSRATTGVRLQKLDEADLVASVALVPVGAVAEEGDEASAADDAD